MLAGFSKRQLRQGLQKGFFTKEQIAVAKDRLINAKEGEDEPISVSREESLAAAVNTEMSLRERQKLARLLKDEEAQASKTGGDQESRQTLSSSQTLAANDPKAQVDVKAVDRQDKIGATPLHIAVSQGKVDRVKRLLKQGPNFKLSDHDGWSALHDAWDVEIAGLLLEAGADPNQINPINGHTPLHEAASNDNLEVMEVLLKNGAQLIPSCEGKTPLDLCESQEAKSLIRGYLKRPGEALVDSEPPAKKTLTE